MKSEYSCEQCQANLFDFAEDRLAPLEKQLVDQHLQHCVDCQDELSAIWHLESRASEWQDQSVPAWNRKRFFFEPSPWPFRMQWVASFVSLLVLVLVLAQARVSTIDGLTISFAGNNDYVSRQDMMQQIAKLEDQQQTHLESSVQKLRSQQITTNQLLLRTIMDANRLERREDLGNLLVLWEQIQDQRSLSTEESLRFLISSQVQDRREIQELNNALRIDNRNF